MITPYKINSDILILEGLLKGAEGKIIHYQKLYAEVDDNGNFIPNGDEILDEHLSYMSLNEDLKISNEGDVITIQNKGFHLSSINVPSIKKRYRFKEYIYNIKIGNENKKMTFPHRIIHYKLNKKH